MKIFCGFLDPGGLPAYLCCPVGFFRMGIGKVLFVFCWESALKEFSGFFLEISLAQQKTIRTFAPALKRKRRGENQETSS
jgi:hypothetical protein